MYYEILSKEYFKEAEILREHIKILRTQYVKISVQNEEDEMKYRIAILYTMYLDLVHTGKYLIKKCEVMRSGEKPVFR